jgi:hypothetical protein
LLRAASLNDFVLRLAAKPNLDRQAMAQEIQRLAEQDDFTSTMSR